MRSNQHTVSANRSSQKDVCEYLQLLLEASETSFDVLDRCYPDIYFKVYNYAQINLLKIKNNTSILGHSKIRAIWKEAANTVYQQEVQQHKCVRVRKQETDDEVYITILGDFVFDIYRDFHDAYKNCNPTKKYKIDFSKVNRIDSSAVGMLFQILEHIHYRKEKIHIIGCHPKVFKFLRYAGLSQMMVFNAPSLLYKQTDNSPAFYSHHSFASKKGKDTTGKQRPL